MEFKHEYLRKMSLKDLVARRVSVLLCSHPRVFAFISDMQGFNKQCHDLVMESKTKYVASELSLPLPLQKEIRSIMKPVSREIIKWLKFHATFLEPYRGSLPKLSVQQHLRWTRLGTINYLETAKALIRSRGLSFEQGYKLACLYCFEEDVRTFWKVIPVSDKKLYFTDGPLCVKHPRIIAIWTYIINGQERELDVFLTQEGRRFHSLSQYAFEFVAGRGYKAATQYFFEKLTPREKTESLERTAVAVAKMRSFDLYPSLHEYQKFSDVLSYLMSVMRKSEQHRLLHTLPFETLKCFLDWPRQEAFIEHAEYVFESCDRLTEEEYSRLLFILTRNIFSGYHYPMLYKNFFLATPKKFREYALDRYALFYLELMKLRDGETIKFILAHLDADEKKDIALKLENISFSHELTVADRWDMMELIMNEVGVEVEEIERKSKEFFLLIFGQSNKKPK